MMGWEDSKVEIYKRNSFFLFLKVSKIEILQHFCGYFVTKELSDNHTHHFAHSSCDKQPSQTCS